MDSIAQINGPQINGLVHQYLFPLFWKILGAFLVWIVGGMAARTLQRLMDLGLERRNVDPTLIQYAHSTLGIVLKGVLVLVILSLFGIESTSFSALLAAAGVAIGVAWSGLLSNFAAGIFLILLRPFRVGDVISAAGVTGVVREIGLFATILDNSENLRLFVGNNKIFSDNICNYTSNAFRVASIRIQVSALVPAKQVLELLLSAAQGLTPASMASEPSAEVTELGPLVTTYVLKIPCPPAQHASLSAEAYSRVQQKVQAAGFPTPTVIPPLS